MNKTKMLAICGVCGAAAAGCLLLVGLVPAMKWAMLFLGAIASVAVVIPLLIDPHNIVYTMLVYVSTSILGIFLGLANIVCVMPLVVFSIPFAIVKVCGETVQLTAEVAEEKVLEDPFGQGDDKHVLAVAVNGKPRLPKVVKWLLYFVLLECALGLTALFTYLFTPDVFTAVVTAKWFWWAVGIVQIIVYPYDVLMTGCLVGTTKILRKAVKPQ